ncbi:hypothetical protein NPIL_698671 [Nephila pilipes]|uniref:Uncharacterized protein n=1 Tax=Nephila pilipes TaxID=299642 RepID=A0A8X6TRI3_NEPPI|nr:hypothetical protein NPIL_698671 [Nephila pilipes]
MDNQNDSPVVPLLTLKDIMKSNEEMEYIKEMRNVLFQIIADTKYFSEIFLHKIILRKRDLKLFRFCWSHAISDHVDMAEEKEVVECFQNCEETEDKKKVLSCQNRFTNLCRDYDEMIFDKETLVSNSPSSDFETSTTLETENIIKKSVHTKDIEKRRQKINMESCPKQMIVDTASSSSDTEISELYEQSNLVTDNEICSNTNGYCSSPHKHNENSISKHPNIKNTENSVLGYLREYPKKGLIVHSIGSILIHFLDSIWFPYACYTWCINSKLPLDYIDIEVETESIDSTYESIWRRLFNAGMTYFSYDSKKCKILKLQKNRSRSKQINILHEIMKRERGYYLNELKLLDTIASPFYYIFPHQNEDEYADFETNTQWYLERDPSDFAVVSFATYFQYVFDAERI